MSATTSVEQSVAIRSALVSVYNKAGLDTVISTLNSLGVRLYATGGTADFIRSMDCMVEDLSDVTGFPSILGGRVKTLHPRIFGGILAIRGNDAHDADMLAHGIDTFDLVIVDLYPFEATVAAAKSDDEIIEKIDIGGVSLLRAAAKNHDHVVVIPSAAHYGPLLELLRQQGPHTTLAQRRQLARASFAVTAGYDAAIHAWFDGQQAPRRALRYGENPHQGAHFAGPLEQLLTQHAGKELSYNNLLDLDAALRLLAEFKAPGAEAAAGATTCVVIKHTNPCGVATRPTALAAWTDALASDPLSAFGGIIALNAAVDLATAQAIGELFFEVLVAPGFAPEALAHLQQKKNRILLTYTGLDQLAPEQVRTVLNGTLTQAADAGPAAQGSYTTATQAAPTPAQLADLRMAEAVAKHLKSNAIAIVRDGQLIGAGMGQTSRIDALRHAIEKAAARGFDVRGAALASDGFFPFADSVEAAAQAGIGSILQPGGSVKDPEVTAAADRLGIPMVLTGKRHFRH